MNFKAAIIGIFASSLVSNSNSQQGYSGYGGFGSGSFGSSSYGTNSYGSEFSDSFRSKGSSGNTIIGNGVKIQGSNNNVKGDNHLIIGN